MPFGLFYEVGDSNVPEPRRSSMALKNNWSGQFFLVINCTRRNTVEGSVVNDLRVVHEDCDLFAFQLHDKRVPLIRPKIDRLTRSQLSIDGPAKLIRAKLFVGFVVEKL